MSQREMTKAMIKHPQIMKTLNPIVDFESFAQALIAEERQLTGIECKDQVCDESDLCKMEVKNSIFKDSSFQHCNFDNSSFTDVVFESCNFSNSRFASAYFERCHFIACKCVGINMRDAIIKQTAFDASNLRYARMDEVRMTDVRFAQIDFTEASMSDAKLKRFEVSESRFVKNSFFKTPLNAVDFSTCELLAPTVSDPPTELKGAIINMFQAADLISLWGVHVERS